MKRRIVVGDIHGCFKTLQKLLNELVNINKEDEIYFLGDYIDRGPSSRDVIDYIIDLKSEGFNMNTLCGNHEDMFIKAITDVRMMSAWFSNGAEETLRSFGIPEEMIYNYEGLKRIPMKYMDFLQNLTLYYELDDYIIVHAGLNFKIDNVFADEDSMLWIRDMKYDGSKIQDKTVIHGHTPMPAISIKNNIRKNKIKMINLDAGCVYRDLPGYGNLVALDLDSGELYIQKNIE